jgi:hypothetical protein
MLPNILKIHSYTLKYFIEFKFCPKKVLIVLNI